MALSPSHFKRPQENCTPDIKSLSTTHFKRQRADCSTNAKILLPSHFKTQPENCTTDVKFLCPSHFKVQQDSCPPGAKVLSPSHFRQRGDSPATQNLGGPKSHLTPPPRQDVSTSDMAVTAASISPAFKTLSGGPVDHPSPLSPGHRNLSVPTSHGIVRSYSETPSAEHAGSRYQEKHSDNASDTLLPSTKRLIPPLHTVVQWSQSSCVQQSSASATPSQVSLTKSSVAMTPAKMWPYSLFNQGLGKVAGLVDTHCHLDFIFDRVGHRGTYGQFRVKHRDTYPDCYEGCVANFCNPASFKQYAVRNPLLDEGGVYGAYGCHPHMAREYDCEVDENLLRALSHPSVVSLGEIGLDYSQKNNCDHAQQHRVFRRQLELALRRKLPLVIHSRDSTQDTLRIMKQMLPEDYPIHRHCFTGGWKEAQEWLDAFPHLCLGLTPLVTFEHVSGKPLAEVARKIPLNRLLLETDSPYFLPQKESRRLRHSHPGMVIHVATHLSRLRNIAVQDIIAVTRENARRIYRI